MLGYADLKKILPHAYPFLLIDRVIGYEINKSLTAIKNVTGNEWCAEGQVHNAQHFPETLLIEAAAQAALVLYHISKSKPDHPRPSYFIGHAKAEFLEKVKIGDRIKIDVTCGKIIDSGGYVNVFMQSENKRVSNLELFFKVSFKS